jgi:hypothetical protein
MSMSLVAVLEQLRGCVVAYPDEETFRRGYPREHAAALRRTNDWAWWSQSDRVVGTLVFPTPGIDLAVCCAERLAIPARVAFAHELAVAFARVFPREVIIRIYLEAVWTPMP